MLKIYKFAPPVLEASKAAEIVNQFSDEHSSLLESDIDGIEVTFNPSKSSYEIAILVLALGEGDAEYSPSPFKFRTTSGDSESYPVAFRKSSKPRLLTTSYCHEDMDKLSSSLEAGSSASPVGANFFGTAGWNIILDDVPVVVSNWHVLCGRGNQSRLGDEILIDEERVAKLYRFEPIPNNTTPSVWDFALARYNSAELMKPQFKPCQDGSRFPYPQALTKKLRIPSDGYYKVGCKTGCTKGSLEAVGKYKIPYGQNGTFWFTNQLRFSAMSDHGDSGSLIVRASDKTATGLLFAGAEDGSYSLANPLYLIGWNSLAPIQGSHQEWIPVFASGVTQSSIKEI